MTDQPQNPSDPLYTVTIFFLGGDKAVVFCDGIDQPVGGQWLQLVSGLDTPKATSVHFNKDLIEKWISREYDPSDADVEVPEEGDLSQAVVDLESAEANADDVVDMADHPNVHDPRRPAPVPPSNETLRNTPPPPQDEDLRQGRHGIGID